MFRVAWLLGLFILPMCVFGAADPADVRPLVAGQSQHASVPLWPYTMASSRVANASGGVFDLQLRPPPAQRDWAGLRKDTGYFMLLQFAVIGVLYVSPESVSSWSEEQKEDFSMDKWKDNVRHIVWDSDDFVINWILHPYWGGTYFVRARNRGFDEAGAFWYSALLSTLYEFGAEALFEEPSIQDLIFTPVLGTFVGEYFMDVRAGIREREQATGRLSGPDKFWLVATDPLGALNEKLDGLFGRSATVSLQPVIGPMITMVHDTGHEPPAAGPQMFSVSEPMLGVKTTIRW